MELESHLLLPFSSTLVPFRDGKFPQHLGNFQLDKHNIEEWSNGNDSNLKHRARKEIGKWVNNEQNADIQFQRRDDATKSSKGHENQKTEIIQGTSPHSQFEIVRTEREVRDEGGQSSRSRISSMSTSYQMSSSRGMKFTSKSSSNKTTTTTSTTHDTNPRVMDKLDDFENIKTDGHLLDTSTQRERISVGRSGTMGIRRPPTRKHTTTPIQYDTEKVDSQPTPLIGYHPTNSTWSVPDETTDILSLKTISPKILVGFPPEIQVELRSKLTSRDAEQNDSVKETEHTNSTSIFTPSELPSVSTILSKPNGVERINENMTSWNSPEDIAGSITLSSTPVVRALISTKNNMKTSSGKEEPNTSYFETFAPSGLSRSWDLMQRFGKRQIKSDRPIVQLAEEKKTRKDEIVEVPRPVLGNLLDKKFRKEKEDISVTSDLRTYRFDSLEPNGDDLNLPYRVELPNWESQLEKSRAEDLNLRNTLTSSQNEKSMQDCPHIAKVSSYPFTARNYLDEAKKESYFNGAGMLSSDANTLRRYNLPPFDVDSNGTKISQTWISSTDTGKPRRHAQDNELTTSISATSQPSTRALRKVEFCKTEVHFTPEPGKFHIVESDENKPSTVHLFRRRKRKSSFERKEVNDPEKNSVPPADTITDESDSLENSSAETVGQLKLTSDEVSLWNELESEGDEIFLSNATSSYEDLKIQKYLDQLKTSTNSTASLTPRDISQNQDHHNYAHNQYIVDQLRTIKYAEVEDDEAEEDELHFRYGSFVPLATRQSLIEMNNRNRMKFLNYSTGTSQNSDASSTSSYSLPHSENSREPIEPPLTKPSANFYDSKVEIGRFELNDDFALKNSTEEHGKDRLKSLRLQSYSAASDRLLQIPKPVMPFDLLHTTTDYRNGRRSYSASPIRENETRFSKPPAPLLPVQFLAFEKSGEALRSRVATKNTKCVCDSSSFKTQLEKTEQEPLTESTISPTAPLKTIVNIVNEEAEVEDINDDNDIPSGKTIPVTRSMVFPKSNRLLEPEWVSKARAKAKSRETGGIEWTQIGQQHHASTVEPNNNNPPWISKLRGRNHISKVDQPAETPVVIYPWEKRHDAWIENDIQAPLAFPQGPKTENLIEIKSEPVISSASNNRSIVDLNRDFESITINPNQIQLGEELQNSSVTKAQPSKSDETISGRGGKVKRNSPASSGKVYLAKTTEKKGSKSPDSESSLSRKPLQTSTTVNRNAVTTEKENVTNRENHRQKPKTPPKPPKPPQRISSLLKSPALLNSSLDRKNRKDQKSSPNLKKPNGEMDTVQETSRTSSLVVHRHPTVKISKLPLRTSPSSPSKSPSPDQMEHLKQKSHVSLMSEAKRICKGKPFKVTADLKHGSHSRGQQSPVPSASPQQRKR